MRRKKQATSSGFPMERLSTLGERGWRLYIVISPGAQFPPVGMTH